MKLPIIIGLILIAACGSYDGDYDMQGQELGQVERNPVFEYLQEAPLPHVQLPPEKGCWFDDNCDDKIWCTGREWCCNRDKLEYGIRCEYGQCYKGPSPCGEPISSVLGICDKEYDTCRGCFTDEECNMETKYTDVNWDWCGGPRRCGGEDEGHHHGVCLGTGEGFPCNWDEQCDSEAQVCIPQPECRYDSDCGPEAWCDENGKCNSY